MADIFSNLYLALSVQYCQRENQVSSILNHIINNLVNENQIIINRVVSNLSERSLLTHIKRTPKIKYEENRNIFNEIMNNENVMNEISA